MFSDENLGFPLGFYYTPLVASLVSSYNDKNLSDEIKQSIEEHQNEFKNEDDLREFIRVQTLKS